MEAGGRKRKVRVNPGHYQHHRDKAQNSGTVPPFPGRLATVYLAPVISWLHLNAVMVYILQNCLFTGNCVFPITYSGRPLVPMAVVIPSSLYPVTYDLPNTPYSTFCSPWIHDKMKICRSQQTFYPNNSIHYIYTPLPICYFPVVGWWLVLWFTDQLPTPPASPLKFNRLSHLNWPSLPWLPWLSLELWLSLVSITTCLGDYLSRKVIPGVS